MIKRYMLILFFVGIEILVFAQREKKVGVLPVPAFGYSPETNTYVGAVSLFTLDFYQDSATRVSNAAFEFNYTWNKQVILEGDWNYYFNEEKWFTQGIIHYSKYPDYYYGIGSKTLDSQEVLFDSKRITISADVLKHLKNKVFVGLGFRFNDYQEVENNSLTISYPELNQKSSWGLGLLFLKDTRNNMLNATKGAYLLSNFGYYLSESNYSKFIVDYRNYHTMQNRFILSWRLYNSFVMGTPPFYDYSVVGGDAYVRGIMYGRFRDRNMSFAQVETRVPLFWRLGLAMFGGTTGIYPKFNSISEGDIKFNTGLGLRFIIDKKENINLRFDYAIGSNKQNGFYVAFGESF